MWLHAQILVIAVVATTLMHEPASAGQNDPPPVFDKRSYAEARSAAQNDHKFLIVFATAPWCTPCVQMERQCWSDEKVVTWLREHAVALALDVELQKAIATDLGVHQLPAMFAFKGEREVQRAVGVRSPDALLMWLTGLERQEQRREYAEHEANARRLWMSGNPDEAADEYVWLWRHRELDAGGSPVRHSFQAGYMTEIALNSPKALSKFVELRDEAGQLIHEDRAKADDLKEWLVLNRIVGEQRVTMAWYDRVRDDARWEALVRGVRLELEPELIAKKRWADLARLEPNPLSRLESEFETANRAMDAPRLPGAEELRPLLAEKFRVKVSALYAGLLETGRDTEAIKFGQRARQIDGSFGLVSRMIETAIDAERPRHEQIDWLAAWPSESEAVKELRKRLDDALRSSKAK